MTGLVENSQRHISYKISEYISRVTKDLLKAAGTPIMRAFSFVNSLKSTLLPGEFSTSTSRLGSLSPTLIKAREEIWKDRAGRAALKATRRMANMDDMINLFVMIALIVVK